MTKVITIFSCANDVHKIVIIRWRIVVVEGRLKLLELRNGNTAGNGGAASLWRGAYVEIVNCTTSGSSVVSGGGAAAETGLVLVVKYSSVIGNHASDVSLPALSEFAMIELRGTAALARTPARSTEEAPTCTCLPH